MKDDFLESDLETTGVAEEEGVVRARRRAESLGGLLILASMELLLFLREDRGVAPARGRCRLFGFVTAEEM